MNNKSIAKQFKLYSQLMELNAENPFRIRAISSAAFKIDKLPVSASKATVEELSSYPGIGKSTAERIVSIIKTGTFKELEDLKDKTPPGVIEMLDIKGVGPKKIKSIWQDLRIESIGELLYACNENRLKDAKGFGIKSQESIKNTIEFMLENKGWLLYAKAEIIAQELYNLLDKSVAPTGRLEYTGDFRRKAETLCSIDFLTNIPLVKIEESILTKNIPLSITEQSEKQILAQYHGSIDIKIIYSSDEDFALNWIYSTGSSDHLQKLPPSLASAESEKEIYKKMGLAYIEPELREGLNEVVLAKENRLPTLIKVSDLKGSLHNHTTYSDGVHTIEEMALYSKEKLNLEYLGICDHSQTAVYAGGLSKQDIERQWVEIEDLNEKLAPFKIFKGIESDILADGSLDYPDDILAKFDLVVASVHSGLRMDKTRATQRLIKAIENPYTTILGHPTSRLLLSRPGYPLDFKKIIEACAANNVVIEINANPLRLDLDWRWYHYAVEKGVLLSINPDAHKQEGLLDVQYGIYVARKGGLEAKNCLNAMNLQEIETFLQNKKRNA